MNTSLLHLLHISDPTLPIGGYTHSAGLETYVQYGLVTNAETAKEFASQMLSRNIQFSDAAYMSLAYDAAANGQIERLLELDGQCTAIKLPMEMRQASQKLGMRLLKIFEPRNQHDLSASFKKELLNKNANGNY